MLIAGETYRLELEVMFDGHRLGSDVGPLPGQVKIREGSTGLWWDGSAFGATEQFVNATPSGGTEDPIAYYDFTVPADAAEGEIYDVLFRMNFDPATDLRIAGQVGSFGGGGGGDMIAHDHTGAAAWDLPIGDRG